MRPLRTFPRAVVGSEAGIVLSPGVGEAPARRKVLSAGVGEAAGPRGELGGQALRPIPFHVPEAAHPEQPLIPFC